MFHPSFLGQVPLRMGESQAPLPIPPEVIYRHPNPDGSRKKCGNCNFWMDKANLCTLHGPTVVVAENMYCNYHVFGAPATEMDTDLDFVKPELSGLRRAGGGLSCDVCVYYRETQKDQAGNCNGVANPSTGKPPAQVESRGICSRQKAI